MVCCQSWNSDYTLMLRVMDIRSSMAVCVCRCYPEHSGIGTSQYRKKHLRVRNWFLMHAVAVCGLCCWIGNAMVAVCAS